MSTPLPASHSDIGRQDRAVISSKRPPRARSAALGEPVPLIITKPAAEPKAHEAAFPIQWLPKHQGHHIRQLLPQVGLLGGPSQPQSSLGCR